ncbi:MAG: cache domain-containing protein [Lachnospiraceae bacterium]|nr:cache domain-containing protein [Lachnospiraceae bacterium]
MRNNKDITPEEKVEIGREVRNMRKVFLKIIAISLIPLVVMGVAIILLENIYFRNIISEEIKRELRTSAYWVEESYKLVDSGDFSMDQNGIVYKGDEQVSGLLEKIGSELGKTELVCTFFFGDTRIDTTVTDESGNNMAGTKLDEEIYRQLCDSGEEIFCESANLGGRTYYGYYIPYRNSDGNVAAVFFAGRLQSEVFANSRDFTITVLWIAFIVLVIGTVVALLCAIYIVGFVFRHFRSEEEQEKKKTAAKNQMEFMTLINREIRDPVDAITILSDRIIEEDTSLQIREKALGIKEACNSMLISFNTIHEYSKLEKGEVRLEKDEYELIKLVDESCKKVMPGIERKHLEIKVGYDENVPNYLKGDREKIRQILDNLLENSVKYTYDGYVQLNVGYRTITPDKADVVFTIKDSGVGIRKEDAQKLFSSIGKVGDNKNVSIKGTGLGLLICKRLVGILDGKISVESEIGKGSTFRFDIPQDVVNKKTVGECMNNDI